MAVSYAVSYKKLWKMLIDKDTIRYERAVEFL